MKENLVKRAAEMAREFAADAEALLHDENIKVYASIPGSRKSGALRRKSMELTQALVSMRNN